MRHQRIRFGAMALGVIATMLGGCADAPPSPYMSAPPMWGPTPAPMPVVRVYEEAPLTQPETVFIDAAPPPMLVEVMPPRPSVDAVWIGGYWGWRSRWVWCTGRWAPPPRPGYVWMHPYYENRDGVVVFVSGFWRAPTVVFAPPPPRLRMPVQRTGWGGMRPMGPPGTFVPPPMDRGTRAWPGDPVERHDADDASHDPRRRPWTVMAPPAAPVRTPVPAMVSPAPTPQAVSPAVAQPAMPEGGGGQLSRRWGPGGGAWSRGGAQPNVPQATVPQTAAPAPVPGEARSPAEGRRFEPRQHPQMAQPEGRSVREMGAPSPRAETARQGTTPRDDAQRRDTGGDKSERAPDRRFWNGRQQRDEQ